MISIIAPAHNEEENVALFVRRAIAGLRVTREEGEVILIDDGSTDKTASIVRELCGEIASLRVVSSMRKEGITASYRKGVQVAQGEIIMFFPTDLESDPEEDIPKLLAPLQNGYDMSVGWRHNKKEEKIKIISSKIFNAVTRMLFGVTFHDAGWVKGCKREVIENTGEMRSDWHRLFAVLAAANGYRIQEVKTNFYLRKHGKSKFGRTGFGRMLGALLDLISVKFMISFSRKPMIVFGTIGLMSFFMGSVGALYLLYLKFALGSIGSRMPLFFAVTLLILSGMQFFVFGFLAEMIASIRDRDKNNK